MCPTGPSNTFSAGRGADGAWQKFERGEIELWYFYTAFGRELSDTVRGNVWYRRYCAQKGIGERMRLTTCHLSPFTNAFILLPLIRK